MHDSDVRKALQRDVLARLAAVPDTLVVHELGLRHGASRVDVAVVNGSLHGYEIKSASDTLERLPSQLATYCAVLDRATLVVADRHYQKARKLLPDWWSIMVATQTTEHEDVVLTRDQVGGFNNSLDPLAIAELLWRSEAADLLRHLRTSPRLLRGPRANIYRALVDIVPLDALRTLVRATLRRRETWRGQRSLG